MKRRPSTLHRSLVCALLVAAAHAFLIGEARSEVENAKPVVQVEVEPKRVVVGQAATLRITLLAPSWMPRPPEYPALELANAVIRLPPDSSYPTSESRDGDTWSGIVREYVFQPLQPGRFRIDGETVGVTYADPETSKPMTVELRMPAIELLAFVPEGAEDLDPFLSGRSLDLSQEIEGDVEDLVAGNAITRTVTVRIDGMAAMFLPPLFEPGTRAGLAVYPGTAEIENHGTVGQRRDTATYVFERGGDYSLDAIELEYWNVEAEQVERVGVESIELSVRGGGPASVPGGDPGSLASRVPWVWVVSLCVLAFGAYRARRLPASGLAWARAKRARMEASEWLAWRRLMKALRRGDARETLRRFVEWDAHPDLRPASRKSGEEVIRKLREAAFAADGAIAPMPLSRPLHSELRALLVAERRDRRRGAGSRDEGRLPPLNPVAD